VARLNFIFINYVSLELHQHFQYMANIFCNGLRVYKCPNFKTDKKFFISWCSWWNEVL